MVFSALARRRERIAIPPAVPEGVRVYAIGDIHGRLDLFEVLIERIRADHAARSPARLCLVLLGDLVDRGPDSSGVIERAMALSGDVDELRCLLGNHEEVFLQAAGGDVKALRFFTRIGGRETLASYGIDGDEYRRADFDELMTMVQARVPARHIAFLRTFEDVVIQGDYAFVHAGIRPGKSIEEQRPKDLRWIREDFIMDETPHDKLIVHGHTITDDVEECSNRIGIDTGAYMSGMLTALCLEGRERWYLKTGG